MTLAQAQAVMNDLLAAGYNASASQLAAGDWQVQTQAPKFVDQPTVTNFGGGHGVGTQGYSVVTSATYR